MAAIGSGEETFTFRHEVLGELTGVITPQGVVQFRAIPYATVPARFKQSILSESLPLTDRDFTKPGFACPQIFPGKIFDGGPHPDDTTLPATASETASLILQLNIPLTTLQSPSSVSKLPILIYIHGGGFVLGRIDAVHNTALLAAQSLADAQPVITASIQYRLGALASLYTPEPGTANRGLHDQRNALLWIQKFGAGFGGDAGRVTVFGESAGALSICYHMLAKPAPETPLFNRVVLMSGVVGPATVPHPVAYAEEVYEEFLGKVGIEGRGKEGLERLREVDVDGIVDVTAKMGEEGTMWWPVLDREWFGDGVENMTWDRITQMVGDCEWVDEFVLGTAGFEGTAAMSKVSNMTAQEFIDGVADQLGSESAALFSKTYGISPDMDANLLITKAMRWYGDVIFDAPTHILAQHLSATPHKKPYRYIFDTPNPFPNNPLYQIAHHWVDVYFVFKTLQFRYPTQRLKDISTKHAQLWIDFANGNAPWAEYEYAGDGVVMVADEREGWVERTDERNEEVRELSWRRCEELVESWKGMKGVAPFWPMDIKPLKGKKVT